MATINSSSTIDDIEAEYLDTLTYREDADVTKCKRFIAACRALLLKKDSTVNDGQGSVSVRNVRLIENQLHAAENWLAQNDPGFTNDTAASRRVKHFSVQRFRS